MLKEKLMEQINNNNHYTIPKYVLSYCKEFNLDVDSLMVLIYFLNQKDDIVFDYLNISKALNMNEEDLMNAITNLKDKKILSIVMKKNDSGVIEEFVDISSFYDIVFSKMIEKEETNEENSNLYDVFEKEYGRTLSPTEYEIINSWLSQNIKEELIIEALKEAIFNGASNLRYIDKILFEWNKKGIKKASDVKKKVKIKDEVVEDYLDYDWLNE